MIIRILKSKENILKAYNLKHKQKIPSYTFFYKKFETITKNFKKTLDIK
jgi:hypothetical protein